MINPEKPTDQESKHPNIELPSEILDILDLDRLGQVMRLTDKTRQKLIDHIENERGTEMFLLVSSIYKTLEPKRFEQDIKINEQDRNDMIDSVENTRSHTEFFISACAQAYRIDGDRMRQEIEILENDWQKILKKVEKTKKYPLDYARLASQANEIKPEGETDIIIPLAEWQQMKESLKQEISQVSDSKLQELAIELRHLKIGK